MGVGLRQPLLGASWCGRKSLAGEESWSWALVVQLDPAKVGLELAVGQPLLGLILSAIWA